jgi:ABC-2 type transport system permease protein/oleandomycin transport system permease protein
MTTLSYPLDTARAERSRSLGDTIYDTLALTGRNLRMYVRNPQLLIFSTIQPVIFVLLFRYVFGGAIRVTGVDYVDFLMPGIFAQVVVFGAMATAIGISADMQTGLIERFQSLPMSRSTVLAGRTFADLVRNAFVVVLMAAVGFAVGWRPNGGIGAVVAGMVLVLLFGYALSWIFATVGLAVRDPEAAQAASFPVLAPLIFASAAFVPIATMPGWLQGFAKNQPLSVIVDAVRDLTLSQPAASDLLGALAWIVGIVAVAAPVAVYFYRRAV